MRALIQRVSKASVTVDGKKISEIGQGLCVFLGVEDADQQADIDFLSGKISRLRIFSDVEGKMNLSVKDVGGQILLVSQFTLFANTRKGNRPSFVEAGAPERSSLMYEQFADALRGEGVPTQMGIFGADMLVEIYNDGPVTIWIDSADARK